MDTVVPVKAARTDHDPICNADAFPTRTTDSSITVKFALLERLRVVPNRLATEGPVVVDALPCKEPNISELDCNSSRADSIVRECWHCRAPCKVAGSAKCSVAEVSVHTVPWEYKHPCMVREEVSCMVTVDESDVDMSANWVQLAPVCSCQQVLRAENNGSAKSQGYITMPRNAEKRAASSTHWEEENKKAGTVSQGRGKQKTPSTEHDAPQVRSFQKPPVGMKRSTVTFLRQLQCSAKSPLAEGLTKVVGRPQMEVRKKMAAEGFPPAEMLRIQKRAPPCNQTPVAIAKLAVSNSTVHPGTRWSLQPAPQSVRYSARLSRMIGTLYCQGLSKMCRNPQTTWSQHLHDVIKNCSPHKRENQGQKK